MTECKHFDLWDSGSETVSDWGEQLDQAHDDHLKIRDESINNLLEREDIDQECLNLNKEQKLLSAEEYREQVGLPITCPHETVDGKDYCIFHLSPESRQNLGITKEDVLNELVNKIKKSTGEDEDKKKCFAGAFLEDISIKYRGLSSESNKPVQFHFAKIDNLDLSHSVIDERFVFNGSEINEISCESTQFQKSVSFKQAKLNCQSVLFDRATFEDRLDMSNTKINTKELSFKECSFRKRVNLSGMNVEIDLESKDDIDTRVQYNNSVFHDELHHNNITFSFKDPDKLTEIYAEFKHCRFSSRANFSDCDFQSTLDDNTTDPSPYDLLEVSTDDLSKEDSEHEIEWYVDFSKSEFESGLLLNDLDLLGDLKLFEATVSNGPLECSNITIEGDFNSQKISLVNGDLHYSNSTVDGDFDCEKITVNNGGVFFKNITIGGDINLSKSTFQAEEIEFDESTIDGSLNLKKVRCDTSGGKITFSGITVKDNLNFRQTLFAGSQIDFSGADISTNNVRGNTGADFREITCSGGQIDFSNVFIGDDARFDLATFSGERAIFEDVEVSGNLSFAEAEFNIRDTKFAGINTTGEQIEFKHVKLPKGKFEIKFFDTVYNLEEAVIGDIKMDSDEFDNDKQEKSIFHHFIFKKTEFDGFNFNQPRIKEGLENSNGKIHTSYADSDKTTSQIKKYYRLIKRGYSDSDYTPNELETTYMEAKLGAKENGDPNAVSKFFQKELHYRRHVYAQQFWEGKLADDHLSNIKKRTRLARDWVANMTLWITAGYGEKPSNLFMTSLIIVLIFAVAYRIVEGLPTGTSQIDYITYSFQGFIQLVVGIEPTGGTVVSLLTAFEGFIGAFFIALFVLTLTRSIER